MRRLISPDEQNETDVILTADGSPETEPSATTGQLSFAGDGEVVEATLRAAHQSARGRSEAAADDDLPLLQPRVAHHRVGAHDGGGEGGGGRAEQTAVTDLRSAKGVSKTMESVGREWAFTRYHDAS
jgi:hypothetical protein